MSFCLVRNLLMICLDHLGVYVMFPHFLTIFKNLNLELHHVFTWDISMGRKDINYWICTLRKFLFPGMLSFMSSFILFTMFHHLPPLFLLFHILHLKLSVVHLLPHILYLILIFLLLVLPLTSVHHLLFQVRVQFPYLFLFNILLFLYLILPNCL